MEVKGQLKTLEDSEIANNWIFERRETRRQKTAVAESKGRSSEKVSEPDREGQMKKRKRQKKSTTGLNLWGRANGWLCGAHSQLGTCGFIQSKRNWKMRKGIGKTGVVKRTSLVVEIEKYEICFHLQIRRAVKLGAIRVAAPAST